ncbi:NACHT domain-containing protein [Streptomyces sp. T-3]|nr:NACHT domain-containing protein [Streptomyces sp. T-3]
MAAEIVTAAAGVLGKIAAKPMADAALRKEAVVRALKGLRLDPKLPPRDFDSLYAYTLIEYCAGRSAAVIAFFRDEYVLEAFRRSFADGDWTRLRSEALGAIERNRETGEFGHLDHGFEEHVDAFTAAFQQLIDRSRAPHEVRLEQKVDELLARVSHTRDEEETHRTRTEPGRAVLSPAERLMRDVRDWFTAVEYEVRRTWETVDGSVALLVDVPQRRGRFDRTVMLCVEGELAPHHLQLVDTLVTEEQACEGWGLARLRVSESARRRAADSDDRLFCYSFDELIDLEADFEPYIAWVEEEVHRRDIDSRYVPLSCRKDEVDPVSQRTLDASLYDWRNGGLDDYVAGWLEEPAKKHLSLLGEFGMGKSWFALHLAGEMAHGWRDAKRRGVPRPRIPLLIPLRDYAKQTSVEALLSEFFFNKHKINLRSYDVFRVLNRMGRLLLIFDGFDEMAARADRNTVVTNFWELANAVEPGAKVLLSSRTEHFPDAQDARDLFGAKVSAAASAVREDAPVFEIVELVPFDDEQIERMLRPVLRDEGKVRTVMAHDDVRDLMRRPVMSELVIDALPEIEQGAEIDLARIYLYAIQRKMDRDIKAERTFTSRGDKLYFLCEVAWEMLSSNRLTLNYRDFPAKLRTCFGPAVASAKDLDYWEQDMRNQGMLVRNAEGDYGPSHKSLLEFLVAYKFVAELGLLRGDFLRMIPGAGERVDGRSLSWSEYFRRRSADGLLPGVDLLVPEPIEVLAQTLGQLEPNKVVFAFMGAIARENPAYLMRLLEQLHATRPYGFGELSMLGGNIANLIVAAGGVLEGTDLAGVSLDGFDPSVLSGTASLAGAHLRGAELTGAKLSRIDLSDADLREARLPGEEMLDDGRFEWGGLALSCGTVVVRSGDELLHWPDGRIDVTPRRIPLAIGAENPGGVWCSTWDGRAFAYSDAECFRIIEGGTGNVRMESGPLSGTPVGWLGRTALAECDFGLDQIRVRDPGSGRAPAVLGLPQVEAQWTGMLHRTVCVHPNGVSALTATEQRMFYSVWEEEAGSWRQLTDVDLQGPVRITGTHGAESFLVSDSQGIQAAVDGTAPAVVQVRGVVPEALRGVLVGGCAFVYRAQAGMAALARHDGLFAWNLGARSESLAWSAHPLPSGVAAMWTPPEGDRLFTLTLMGGLTVRDFRTGEILSRTMLTTRLKGTRFSRDCGFDDVTLDAITHAGGIIDDGPGLRPRNA